MERSRRFYMGVGSKLSNGRCGEDQPEGHGHDDQKCRDAAVNMLVSRAGTRSLDPNSSADSFEHDWR
jgi:hypothetical protein